MIKILVFSLFVWVYNKGLINRDLKSIREIFVLTFKTHGPGFSQKNSFFLFWLKRLAIDIETEIVKQFEKNDGTSL